MIATTTRLVVGGWCELVTASGGALAAAIVEAVLVDFPCRRSRCTSQRTPQWSLPGA